MAAKPISILERLLKISAMCGFALAGVGIDSDVNAFLSTIADPRLGAPTRGRIN